MTTTYNGEIFLKINSVFHHLGKAEKQVATFIRNYPEEVKKLPINILAEKVGVSVSTIIRLCRKIGVEGYSELKLELAKDLALGYKANFIEINTNEPISLVLNKAEEIFYQTIKNTFRILDHEDIQRSYQEIIKANRVLVVATGGSAAAAKILNHQLLKLGINISWSNDFTEVPLIIDNLGSKDLLFAISHSGTTSSVYNAVVMAKEKGCKIITLTNYLKSPLACESDIVLATAVDEKPLGSETGPTRMAQISIIEVLSLLIAIKKM